MQPGEAGSPSHRCVCNVLCETKHPVSSYVRRLSVRCFTLTSLWIVFIDGACCYPKAVLGVANNSACVSELRWRTAQKTPEDATVQKNVALSAR
jgi:hypothetical protein